MCKQYKLPSTENNSGFISETIKVTKYLHQHLSTISQALTNEKAVATRQKILNWTFLILKNLGLKRRTSDLALMLVDALLFTEHSDKFGLQLLCVSSILFAIKLERDYNENLGDFSSFLNSWLKLTPKEIQVCESFILVSIPSYFGFLVGFSEVLQSFSNVLELSSASKTELEFLSNKVVDAYIKAETKLTIESIFVELLLKAYYPKKGAEGKRKKLLTQLHNHHDQNKRLKAPVNLDCKTVRLQAAKMAVTEQT